MIAFTTLFLGLAVGIHPVEVAVGDEVAVVEILLDGRGVARVTAEPWRTSCDFGAELSPQVLEAVAYGADRRELGRARQVVNLPHPPAAVSVVVDTDPATGTSVARLAWESLVGGEPRSVSAWMDGRPLAVEDPRAIVLPPHDRASLHLFAAELEFGDNVSTPVTATFGGLFADQVQTELTAIPIRFEGKKKRMPAADAMRGWFTKGGEPLEPFAVEKGRSEIVLVLGTRLPESGTGPAWRHRDTIILKSHQVLRLLQPVVEKSAGVATTFNLFPISPDYDYQSGGLYWLLTRVRYSGDQEGQRRLADAVAVAGLAAYERSYRRAVILLLDRVSEDASQISAEQSRRYLERLRVPFVLWTPNEKERPIGGWGKPVNVSTIPRLGAAFDEVAKGLARQWIVWFEGRHLPQEIEISEAAEGVELVTSAPP